MSFASIYAPSYFDKGSSSSELVRKYGRITCIVLAIHFSVFLLLYIQPRLHKPEIEQEIVVEVSSAPQVADGTPEAEKSEQPKKSQVKQPPQSAPKQQVSERVQEAPSNADPVMKFNESVIKPLIKEKVEEPVKERVEEKKAPTKEETAVEVPNILPAVVDKKNKEKEAPVVPPPSGSPQAAQSTGAPDSGQSSPTSGGSSTPTQSSASSAPAPSQASTGFQAQISNVSPSQLGLPGGSASTSDADYKSNELKNPKPPYPMYAYKMRQQGTVTLIAEVLTNGNAGEVKIVSSSGSELLDRSALETVKGWNFKPAKKDGVPYIQKLRIPITFNLNNR